MSFWTNSVIGLAERRSGVSVVEVLRDYRYEDQLGEWNEVPFTVTAKKG